MKRPLLGSALAFALLMLFAGGAARPAEAGDWYIGGNFRVGGVHFSLAFDRLHRHDAPNYYYRTHHRVRHDGYRCGSYCFKRSSYTYHHPSCPLVLHHFRRHDYHPARVWDVYGGRGHYDRRGRGHAYGHDSYKRHDSRSRHHGHRDYGYRGDRYRGDRYRGDRYDDHRHHDPRYCPYR